MFGQPNKEIERLYKPPEIVKTIDMDFDKEEFGKIVKKKHTIKIMCFFDDVSFYLSSSLGFRRRYRRGCGFFVVVVVCDGLGRCWWWSSSS